MMTFPDGLRDRIPYMHGIEWRYVDRLQKLLVRVLASRQRASCTLSIQRGTIESLKERRDELLHDHNSLMRRCNLQRDDIARLEFERVVLRDRYDALEAERDQLLNQVKAQGDVLTRSEVRLNRALRLVRLCSTSEQWQWRKQQIEADDNERPV